MPQKYKYESILKTFQYSKESYQIISDFLLSGDITNPDILLNVTKVSKEFGKIPKDWLRMPSTVSFIKALIQVKIEAEDKKFLRAFNKLFYIEKNDNLIDVLNTLDYKEVVNLLKEVGFVSVKKGGNGNELQGTWLHRDLIEE
jgi:hypothetical protein